MRRLLAIVVAAVTAISAGAQGKLWMDESLVLGYNRSWGLYDWDDTVVGFDLPSFGFRGGLRLTDGAMAAELGAHWFYRLNDGHRVGLEAFGTWSSLSQYNITEFNTGALALWSWKERVKVKAGSFFKWLVPFGGGGAVSEPFNFAYSVSFWALAPERTFNFGASLSNLDYFAAERFYCPYLTLRFRYSVYDNCQVYLNLREHSSGTFDLTSNFFDHQVRIGTIVSW
ncbi:MAG: hypothetical protein J5835_01275 [Bacteroidales bacterium]|nr:hypothetical protein [Bacteroidales bacterium]